MTEIIKTPSPLDLNIAYEVIVAATAEQAQAEFDKAYPKLAGLKPTFRLRDNWYFPATKWSAA